MMVIASWMWLCFGILIGFAITVLMILIYAMSVLLQSEHGWRMDHDDEYAMSVSEQH